jgi:hypothetical protein
LPAALPATSGSEQYTWGCSAEPCTYPLPLLNTSIPQDPHLSPELSTEAVKSWASVSGNDGGYVLLFGPDGTRFNHQRGNRHLSEISGVKNGTNNLLISYWMSHFWPGNVPNSFQQDCYYTTAWDCFTTPGCRWESEFAPGGRCLYDPCTQQVGTGNCADYHNCEFRGGICRARPTHGGPRFTLAPFNSMRPWCLPDDC